MMDEFLVRAMLAGLGVAVIASVLGCFVIWRRMAYFGDATAHAAILGVAFALSFEISIVAGVLIVAVAMAIAVSSLSDRTQGADTLLGVLSHASLALGLVAVSLLPGARVNLETYLFGDILAVTWEDVGLIWMGTVVGVGLLVCRWSALLTTTLNSDLAIASGLSPARERLTLTLSLAIVVAIAIKVVGALLITALLIIPAASARQFSKTPEMMVAVAVIFGAASAVGGLQAALVFDTPAGPTIVSLAAAMFLLSRIPRRTD